MYRSAAAARRFALLIAAAAAGGVLVSLGPSAAVANADGVDWDAVAACESGGDWRADTGNGFYGGLQFKPATWKEFGGKGSPAQASRAEQIAVANRLLAARGPAAWPKCGPETIRGSNGAPKEPGQTTGSERAVRGLIKTLWSALPG